MAVELRGSVRLRRVLVVTTIVAAFASVCGGARMIAAPEGKRAGAAAKTVNSPEVIARGRYLVEDVAICGNCHSPRDENGQPDHSHWLEGGPVFFQPASPMQDWPLVAPRLAGTPPASDAAIITLLTTGIWTNGKPLRQPMPRFHMTQSDAEAVLAYLKSL